MIDPTFWAVIEQARVVEAQYADEIAAADEAARSLPVLAQVTARMDARQSARSRALKEILASMTTEQVIAYRDDFWRAQGAAYDWGIWNVATLLDGGASDDGFYYFRCWMISEGKEVYEAALKDPDSLALAALTDDMLLQGAHQWEDVCSVWYDVLLEQLGEDGVDDLPDVPDSWPDTPTGEEADMDDQAELARRFPRTWERVITALARFQ